MRLAARARRVWTGVGRIARISRWEVSRSAGTVDRRTAIALVLMLAVASGVGASIGPTGVGLEDDIYAVGVDADHPYATVATESDQFRVVEPTSDEADIRIEGNEIHRSGPPTGDPAYVAFRDAVEEHNNRLMAAESDTAAAYPVTVQIQYQQRESVETDSSSGSTDDSASDGGNGDGGSADDPGIDAPDPAADGGDSPLSVPAIGGSGGSDTEAGSPGSISPPFPFQSLVLAFLFVVPMNFIIQTYGSTIMDERIKRRGELLLVSPVSRHEIVAGKTLPYLLGLLGVVVAIATMIGGGITSIAAVLPIALLFLAATFVGAMFARSFKELTFLTVGISVFLTTYTFVPAIFTDVTPVALISPLTLVVMDLQGEMISAGAYLFSTGTFYLGAAVLFGLGLGVYREEDMFAQKPVPAKLIDAIATHVHKRRHILLLSIVFLPFVFAGQLLAVALLFALPRWFTIPVILVFAAAIEEVAKSIHVYAGFTKARFESTVPVAIVLGAFAGTGFFIGEKVTHLVQIVGLPELELGQAVFGPSLELNPLLLLAVFLAPLVLHVITAAISAIGASRGRTQYALALIVAILVHTAYNLGVVFYVT